MEGWGRVWLRRVQLRSAAPALCAILAVGGLGWWGLDHHFYVHTDDARIVADIVAVSAAVSGQISEVYVQPGDRVAQSQPLLQIDPEGAVLRLRELRAESLEKEAEIARERIRADGARASYTARLDAAAADVMAARAAEFDAETRLELERAEFVRAETLKRSGFLSAAAFERSRQALSIAEASVARARAARAAADAAREEVLASTSAAAVIDADIAIHQQALIVLREACAAQSLIVSQHRILAPIAGRVDDVFVQAGEHAHVGARVLVMHDPDDFRIEANVREVDLHRVAVGAPVSIRFDAAPGRVFHARVVSVATAAASEFAVLPAPNASGAFTRMSQRFRVVVSIDPDGAPQHVLRPGSMVRLRIRAR
ncbi:HlyD family efflux transporter periplasmic adaptor subunit [bacterium]|nr:HlyD family efflux transporter periplasmic adaptor subunit [bacterium]